MSKAFNEASPPSAAGNFDEAIAKFNEAIKTNPQCSDCYYNIGVAHAARKTMKTPKRPTRRRLSRTRIRRRLQRSRPGV